MRTHLLTERLLDAAEAEQRCAVGLTETQRQPLRRRRDRGILVSPYCNVYARSSYWNGLDPIQRHVHVLRALSILHPTWVFAGLSAASIHGLEHAYAMHDDEVVTVASSFHSNRGNGKLKRIYIPNIGDVSERRPLLSVTNMYRTLVDCALTYSFSQTLPLFDSAVRRGTDIAMLPAYCKSLGFDSAAVMTLCHYADPLSENGGESFMRAKIAELEFIMPRLQRPFHNPNNPEAPFRADFSWELPDGTIIVAEFDGMSKYVLDDGTRRGIQARVHAERERETCLYAGGVMRIVRLEYEDGLYPERLERKLREAGVPKRR